MGNWIDFDMIMSEISLHRSNLQRCIKNYKEKENPTDFEKIEYREAIGSEITLMCLEQWCKDFKFTTKEVVNFKKNTIKDSIYLIYEDGHYELFTGENDKAGIKYVGVVFGGHSFAVALKDLPEQYLVRDTDECEKDIPLYNGEVDAIFDWDAEAHTKHIVEVGTDIPLKGGEFIPTVAMLVAMYRMREQLNKILEYAGGEPLKTDDYYWSSNENSQCNSWVLYFGSGYLNSFNKGNCICVRPCTTFNL